MSAPQRVDATAEAVGIDGLVDVEVVDGVPVFLAPRAGLVTGGLIFRVGTADEQLPFAGITHVVEHLALYRLNLTEGHHNGQTDDTFTLFHVTGTVEEVVAFLNGVCASLRDLPVERLATELEIVRTEAARREGGPAEAMRVWRFGPQGFGLRSYDELGTWRLDADAVRAWAAERFTRENVVAFVTAQTAPPGLDLTLPTGRRIPPPEPEHVLPALPAYFRGARGNVVLDAVVPRSTASSLFGRLASRVLFRELRQEGGLSYVASARVWPLTPDAVCVTLWADALEEKQDAVVGGMVDALAALRAGSIDPEDVEAVRTDALRDLEVPELGAAMLTTVALDHLHGVVTTPPAVRRQRLEAVTAADLAEVARQVWDGALLQVPAGDASWAGFAEAPPWSAAAVEGPSFPRVDDPDVRLVLGAHGVSVVTPRGAVTVVFDECVAMTAWPDGARELVGRDGFRIRIEPTLYAGLGRWDLAQKVDTAVAVDRVVQMPARDPESIPQPDAAVTPAPTLSARRREWRGQVFGWAVTLVVLTVLRLAAHAHPWIGWVVLVVAVAAGLGVAVRWWLRTRGGASREH